VKHAGYEPAAPRARQPAGAPAWPRAGRARGFTLMEVMITITVLAIVLTVGVPGFQGLIQNSRVAANTNDLISAMNIARSEAGRRGVAVTVCASTDGATCSGGATWDEGWIVFATDEPGNLLRVWDGMRGDPQFDAQPPPRVTFSPRGGLEEPGAGFSFTLSAEHCTGANARRSSVSATGRPASRRIQCVT